MIIERQRNRGWWGGAKDYVKAYIDLTRAHFAICWPLLFCSGLMLAFANYGGFSWSLTIRAALIGLFGFEAGMVLNDYVDREVDKKDVEFDKLTKYWRPFNKRPIPSGLLPSRSALILFLLFVGLALGLVATLPYPNSLYLAILMLISYSLEYFYQVKKRQQRLPLSQLLGRIDFALFPVAGYLCHGSLDRTVLMYFVFFYPWAIAHLGVNDLVDIRNDEARELNSVTALYGLKGTARWILIFTLLHVLVAPLFLMELGPIALVGFLGGFLLLGLANYKIIRKQSPEAGLAALPIFHLTMVFYVSSIILNVAAVEDVAVMLGGDMIQRKRKFQSQTMASDAVTVGNVAATPQSQALTMRWPQGGWVWNRPAAVLVKQGEQERRIPIVDVTRVAQLALYGTAAVFTMIGLIQMMRQGGKHK